MHLISLLYRLLILYYPPIFSFLPQNYCVLQKSDWLLSLPTQSTHLELLQDLRQFSSHMNALFSSEHLYIPADMSSSNEVLATLPLVLSDLHDRSDKVFAKQTVVVYDPPETLTYVEHTGIFQPLLLILLLLSLQCPKSVVVQRKYHSHQMWLFLTPPIQHQLLLILISSRGLQIPPNISKISCVTWNIHGVANMASRQRLHKLCRIH